MKKRYAKRLIPCTNTDRVGGVKSLQHFNLDTGVGFATQKSEIKRGINHEIKKRSKKRGDNTDMYYSGYCVNEDNGSVYHTHSLCGAYFDLEYYDKELIGENRTLIAISNYLKGNIDLELLLNAYKIITAEKEIANQKEYLPYSKDWLKMGELN